MTGLPGGVSSPTRFLKNHRFLGGRGGHILFIRRASLFFASLFPNCKTGDSSELRLTEGLSSF